MLNLTLPIRRRHGVPSELLGLVHPDGHFRHAKCHPTVETLVTLLRSDDHIAVASTDDWRRDAGPCAECGGDVDAGGP